jgi:2'-5' RNA ligase
MWSRRCDWCSAATIVGAYRGAVAARQSAIIIPVAVPGPLARLRRSLDPSAARGVPPHLTLLYPFVPAESLEPDVRQAVESVARDVSPFALRFSEARTWPGVAWLAPEPAGPIRALIARLTTRFPEYPPYGGAFDEVIPHLTIVERGDIDLAAVVAAAASALPFAARVVRVSVIAEGDDGRWRMRWRLPLGVRR